MLRRVGRSPLPQRFDQRGYVTAILGREFVDAGDQEFPLPVASGLLTCRGVIVVMQSRGLGGSGTDGGHGHVKSFGERVDCRRPRGPDKVPRRGEGVDGRPGQPAAPGDFAVRPASLVQPLQDQPLEGVSELLRRCDGVSGLLPGDVTPVIGRVRRHSHQPNPSSPEEISS